jgi:hypothetical protein
MEVTKMNQERKTFAIDEDLRKSLTHERPEPKNNAPTGRQTRKELHHPPGVRGQK